MYSENPLLTESWMHLDKEISTMEAPAREQCQLCKRTFLTCVALNIHSTKKHNKKRIKTDTTLHCPCGQTFTAKWRQNCVHKLNTHGRYCKAFKKIEMRCDVCMKGFISRKSLEFHCLKAHKLAVSIEGQEKSPEIPSEKEEILIEEYRRAPILWDPSHQDYKNKVLRNAKLKEIGETLGGYSVESVNTTITSIKSAFLREVRLLEAQGNWPNTKPDYVSEFKHFDKLQFLKAPSSADRESTNVKSEEIEFIRSFSDEARNFIFDVDVDIDVDEEIVVPDCSQSLLESSSTSSQQSNLLKCDREEDFLAAATKALVIPEDDEEMGFARSLAGSLRKFDRVNKEKIKLEIQRIIVKYTIDSENEESQLSESSPNSNCD